MRRAGLFLFELFMGYTGILMSIRKNINKNLDTQFENHDYLPQPLFLEDLDAAHSDYEANPITSEIVANAEKTVQDILASDTFAEASSKMGMRKYVRAMQDVEHSLGAATHILRSSEELASSSDSTKDSQTVADYGQRNTVNRIT